MLLMQLDKIFVLIKRFHVLDEAVEADEAVEVDAVEMEYSKYEKNVMLLVELLGVNLANFLHLPILDPIQSQAFG
jgi:hypothetical protein